MFRRTVATAVAAVVGFVAMPAVSASAEDVFCKYRVTVSNLPVYSGPGTAYSQVGTLSLNQTVTGKQATTNGYRWVGSDRWASASGMVKTSALCFT